MSAIANGPRPKTIKKRYDLKDQRHVKATTERVFRKTDDALILFSSSLWQTVTLGEFYPPDRGRYHCALYDPLAGAVLLARLAREAQVTTLSMMQLLALSTFDGKKRDALQQRELF